MRPKLLLTVFLAIISGVSCSSLGTTDLERLLEEDWSVIQRAVSNRLEASSPGLPSATEHPASASQDSQALTHTESPRGTDPTYASPLSTLRSQLDITFPSLFADRLPVSAPRSVPVLQQGKRLEELQTLSQLIRSHKYGFLKPRLVMPLRISNMSPQTYRVLYEQYFSHIPRLRVLWTPSAVTYMLYKPDKDDYMFKEIFGGDVTAKQQVMVVWRHETHGEARIWRLLGMIELPSHTRAHSFITQHMQKISKSYGIPLRYFNDGTHLDPSQVEAQSGTSKSETRHD